MKITTLKDLTNALEIDYNYFYYQYYKKKICTRYTKYQKGKRHICVPNPYLKNIQKRINTFLLEKDILYKKACHSYIKGRSYITNAKEHCNKKRVIKLDIKNFFPSIHFGRVLGIFESRLDLSKQVAIILTNLCCYDSELPQGAPSSPTIANLLCNKLDKAILHYLRTQRGDFTYTRYADDLTISTNSKDEELLNNVIKFTNEIIIKNRFKPHEEKQVLIKSKRKYVTGVVVNEKLNIKNEYRRHLRSVLFKMNCNLEAGENLYNGVKLNQLKSKSQDKFKIIDGRLNYINDIRRYNKENFDSVVYSLFQQRHKLCFKEPLRTSLSYYVNQPIRLYVEGPTDKFYIEKAIEYFETTSRQFRYCFSNFEIIVIGGAGGYPQYLRTAKALDNFLHIFLFDRDILFPFRNPFKGDMSFKKLKNNNYSLGEKSNIYFCVLPQVAEFKVCEIEHYFLNSNPNLKLETLFSPMFCIFHGKDEEKFDWKRTAKQVPGKRIERVPLGKVKKESKEVGSRFQSKIENSAIVDYSNFNLIFELILEVVSKYK